MNSDVTAKHRYSQISCSNHLHTLEVNCGTSVYASKEIRKSSVNSEQTKRSAEKPKEHRTNRLTPQSKVLFVKMFDS